MVRAVWSISREATEHLTLDLAWVLSVKRRPWETVVVRFGSQAWDVALPCSGPEVPSCVSQMRMSAPS